MATSPIYSWPEPDNTDLVKNGALAIRTLGNAIDTTMATMVSKTIVDAKGDLIAGTAADTAARLAVGNNGETLVADSSTATGLRYTAGTVQSNPVLNSAMQVWQRGTSFSVAASTNAYTADRWQLSTAASQACTVSRQTTSDTTNLPNIQYATRVQRNSGQTGTGVINFTQSFETINSIPYAGKTVTVSLYARAGANYSAASNALAFGISTGTGTDQNLLGYTGAAYPLYSAATLTTTWQRFTVTGTIATTANELGIYVQFTPVGTAGTNDYYEITGVQIDIGSVALPFRTYGGTIQGELAACQRYYYNFANGADKPIGVGFYNTATNAQCVFKLPVTMRTNPTLVATTGTNYYQITAGGVDDAFNSLTIFNVSTESVQLYNNTEVSGTIGYAGQMRSLNASASAAFSAEL